MGKYDKFSISGLEPGKSEGPGITIANFNGEMFEGSNEYNCHWVYKTPRNIHGWTKWRQVIHGPHVHKYPEVIYLLGTDPENPMDLGAEVEMHMGPELEQYVLTKSCLIYIPANFVHGWWVIREVIRPFIVFDINQSPTHTEKALRELVPEALRKRMMFIDQGYESDERIVKWPEETSQKKYLKRSQREDNSKTGKYDKYIISGLGPGERDSSGKTIAHIDGDTFEGSNEYWAHWAFEKPRNVPGWNEWSDITHGPHMHKFPEVVGLLGTDPDNPKYLGVEFDAYMGPEMVRDLNTASRISFMPANFVHGPSTVKKVTRPFIFIEINQSPRHTQKGLIELVPDLKDRDKMMFIDVGYDSPERRIRWPKGLGYQAKE